MLAPQKQEGARSHAKYFPMSCVLSKTNRELFCRKLCQVQKNLFFHVLTFQCGIGLDLATIYIFAIQPSFTLMINHLVISFLSINHNVQGSILRHLSWTLCRLVIHCCGRHLSQNREHHRECQRWVGFNNRTLFSWIFFSCGRPVHLYFCYP